MKKLPLGIELLQNFPRGTDVLQNLLNGKKLPNGAKTLGGVTPPTLPGKSIHGLGIYFSLSR